MLMRNTPRPIFHIGYHKTATTWFQKSVWPAAVTHDYVPRADARSAFLDDPGFHFDPERASALLNAEARERPIAVCEENLSGYIHNGGLHGMIAPEVARRIAQLFPQAAIVLFIRRQPDMLRATYAQYVSGGGTHGPERYFFPHAHSQGALRYPYKAPGFSLAHFEYDRLIGFYDKIFGRENVHVYLFEDIHADSAGLLRRMEADLGLAFDHEAISHGKRNASLGWAGLLAMRCVNLFTRQSVVDKTVVLNVPGWQAVRHAAKAIVARTPYLRSTGRDVLGRRLTARISEHYGPSNQRLAELRALPLEKNGYPM